MRRLGIRVCAATLAAALLSGSAANAENRGGIKIGMLTCNVSSGWGVIFGSTRDLRCNYQPVKGSIEHYTGHISKFGIDIGYTQGGVIVWAVFAPTTDLASGSLDGDYGGATAGASVGIGADVHALVGGFHKTISLQPVSIEGNTGLNVAAGIAQMRLRYRSF